MIILARAGRIVRFNTASARRTEVIPDTGEPRLQMVWTREKRPRKVENYASERPRKVGIGKNVPSVWSQISEEWHNVVQFP